MPNNTSQMIGPAGVRRRRRAGSGASGGRGVVRRVASSSTAGGAVRRVASGSPPETASPLVDYFVESLKSHGIPTQTGKFGADMLVEIHNDGPVTILLEI